MKERPNRLTHIDGRLAAEVLASIRIGDEAAFASLYQTLYTVLWRIALLVTRSADTADEIVQDVFFTLWMRRETLDVDSDIRVYLAAAVRNRASDIGRHRTVVSAVEQAVKEATLAPPAISAGTALPDMALESQEFYDAYNRALALLVDRERIALLLRWEEGLTFEQIGQVLGLSTVGARAVVLRGQQKVQDALADYRT